ALVEAGAVAVFLQRGVELTLAAATGEVTERMRGWTVPVEGSELGETVRTLVARSLSGPPEPPELGLRERLGAEVALLVPLQVHAGGLGVLVACDRPDGEEFSEEDERLLRAFASSASMAVAMAQSVEQQRLRERIDAAERERHHWAHELHDETLQQLAAIRIKLATALRSGTAPDTLAQVSREAADDLEREIAALSRLIGELRPIPLETLGLGQALESLAQESAERGSFEAETSIALEGLLSTEQERAIYRLVQESLNNVVKHSGAGRARIEARPGDGSLTIVVRDDGRGFDVKATPAGVGLNGMRERIELLGGNLEIGSSTGEGTLVSARIPIEPARG
ncbi:MAG: GAF domain-containing sensor histidine kinase, partial [Solirubrobacterales bacterium]